MKLLKVKAFLHGVIFIFSLGMVVLMLAETQNNLYPDVFCYVCAGVSLINVFYSAWLLVDCNKEIERKMDKERR